MKDLRERTCFDCRISEIDPGTPDVYYLSNGDPGYPGDPASAMCTDPLASQMAEKFDDMVYEIHQAIKEIVFHDFKNNKNNIMPFQISQSIAFYLSYHGDFAPFCPMFQQRTKICSCCGEEYPTEYPMESPTNSQEGDNHCKKCGEGILQWEKEHKEELEGKEWYPIKSEKDYDIFWNLYKKFVFVLYKK